MAKFDLKKGAKIDFSLHSMKKVVKRDVSIAQVPRVIFWRQRDEPAKEQISYSKVAHATNGDVLHIFLIILIGLSNRKSYIGGSHDQSCGQHG